MRHGHGMRRDDTLDSRHRDDFCCGLIAETSAHGTAASSSWQASEVKAVMTGMDSWATRRELQVRRRCQSGWHSRLANIKAIETWRARHLGSHPFRLAKCHAGSCWSHCAFLRQSNAHAASPRQSVIHPQCRRLNSGSSLVPLTSKLQDRATQSRVSANMGRLLLLQ